MYIRYENLKKEELLRIAYEDLGKNYFILLGLSLSKLVYEEVYYFYTKSSNFDELEAILLKRRSGNLQLMCRRPVCSPSVIRDFHCMLENLAFKELITSNENLYALEAHSLFSKTEKGALISKTDHIELSKKQLSSDFHIRPLHESDVDAIEDLYKLVFPSFTPPEVIKEKLRSKRGRGVGLYHHNTLIATAQTDFETDLGAIIVGVASHPDYQHQGFGHVIMTALCQPLIDEGKQLYLHYNSPIAGKLYDKMSFTQVDQIMHCKK